MKKKLYLIFEIETPYFLNCKVECMDWGNFFLKVWYDTRVCHQLELVLEPFRLLGGKIGIEISWWIGPMFSILDPCIISERIWVHYWERFMGILSMESTSHLSTSHVLTLQGCSDCKKIQPMGWRGVGMPCLKPASWREKKLKII